MPIKITMPALSPTMEEGNLSKWNIKEGDKVSSGDVIAEIETDKATMEVEAIDEGTVAKIVVPAGTQGVKVNALIVILAEEGEDLAEAVKAAEEDVALSGKKSKVTKQVEAKEELVSDASLAQQFIQRDGDNTCLFASPLARRLAAESDFDLSVISGTGPHGRIIKRDVEKALSGGTLRDSCSSSVNRPIVTGAFDEQVMKLFKESEYTFASHNSMRKTIAKRLVESKSTIPHFYVTVDCELDALLKLRAELNAIAPMVTTQENMNPAYKLSVNDMVIKAVALSLRALPDANVSWLEGGMLYHKHCDVGVAVSIPNGLITPIIRHAEEKSLPVISNEMKDFATRARANKLKPEEYQGGTTAISNMGMYGVKDFSAIINPPHATIFAIGAGEQRAVVKNGALAIATVMSVTLSVDHRAVDGALAAELAQTFKKLIENPLSILV
ncbi:pyruvate dehydrogenase complex dihydrolipoamide acetyltransferase [Bartonella bacilliformis str. Heidi Mejia]|uniref:pyruvate dehydrogenase complex dihydrolipoamide acetyltransferase n=1 Tax=Bartonella bacilliformis TaxID=774 RepID=UPI000450F540|nr:pyruvate dehydrogenase complex dihydrolipoamide acetyltransferase [Bartonella bacilliformis]EYS92185.1 pyruvate dehydrogenase complex dihydrolipoamide acetyltransferase [Bartonella bacilliformis str. Heidi Mejia]KEG18744.1 pyruvate dehydrogenase complex dihydrolipoamide acetyltransferase [Bartonella bacilliformis Hosp800-02]KEG23852.1 pyruvate dehydrogenase complex dihydrolipoamide acetyltransferase [Bartonella bacilliformis VAB9028]KEG24201.1 pyruvate dehydrogenase complex dihydrolipoamide 